MNNRAIVAVVAVIVLLCAGTYVFLTLEVTETVEIDGLVFEIRDGEATLIGCTEEPVDMVIPSQIEYLGGTATVTGIGESALESTSIQSVVIPDTVTHIDAWAMADTLLSDVLIPASVTYLDDTAFSSTKLRTAEVEQGNEHYVSVDGKVYTSDMTRMVLYPSYDGVTEFTIPDGVKTVGLDVLAYPVSIEVLNIGTDLESIEGDVLVVDNNLVSINVDASNPSFTSMNGALYTKDMTTLIRAPTTVQDGLTVPEGVKRLDDYSLSMTRYDDVTLPEGLEEIGYGCFYNASFSVIDIPDTVTSIEAYAFSNCIHLTELAIPLAVETLPENFISGCLELEVLDLGNAEAVLGNSELYSLREIRVSGDNQHYTVSDGILYTRDMTTLVRFPAALEREALTIPDGVTSIEAYAFEQCLNITSVTLPSTMTDIGDYAFTDCSSLEEVVIPDGIGSIGRSSFNGCFNLEYVELPGSLRSIGKYAFAYSGLVEIGLPEGLETISDYAFSSCENLTSLTIPSTVSYMTVNDKTYSLTEIRVAEGNEDYVSVDGVLFTSDMKCLVQYPAAKPSEAYVVPDGVETIGSYSFCYSQLTAVTLPESLGSIGTCAFMTTGLTSVILPAGVGSVGYEAFAGCLGLGSVVFQEGTCDIEDLAFAGCRSLTSVTIPGAAAIGDGAFALGNASVTVTCTVVTDREGLLDGCGNEYTVFVYV